MAPGQTCPYSKSALVEIGDNLMELNLNMPEAGCEVTLQNRFQNLIFSPFYVEFQQVDFPSAGQLQSFVDVHQPNGLELGGFRYPKH